MSTALTCEPRCCPEELVVNTPGPTGPTGAAGTDGTDGASAFTLLAVDLPLVAAIGDQVTATVADNSGFAVGQTLFLSDGTNWGTFQVISLAGSTGMLIEFLGAVGDTAVPFTIANGALVTAGGRPATLAAPLPMAFTDGSGGTASNTLALVGLHTIEFPHAFIGGTAAVEPVSNYQFGFNFKIIGWVFVTKALLVGAAGSRIANMEINTTDVGTVVSTVTIPIANAAVGTVTAGTAVSGTPISGNATDTFSVEIQAGGTQFTAGEGTFIILVQNIDDANAAASLAAHVDALITSLT